MSGSGAVGRADGVGPPTGIDVVAPTTGEGAGPGPAVTRQDDEGAGSPRLASERVLMRVIHPQDYPFLYELSVAPELRFRWRFRAEQPTYEDFVRTLGTTVFDQYLVVDRTVGTRLGHVVCYRASRGNGTAYVGVAEAPQARMQGSLVEAGRLFFRYLFDCHGFRKLYLEVPGYNISQFSSAPGNGFVEEGVLRDHEWFLGRWWDLHLYALYREGWERRFAALGERARRLRLAGDAGAPDEAQPPSEFEDFRGALGRVLALDLDHVSAGTSLRDDGIFDSIQVCELLCALDDLGVAGGDNLVARCRTFGDLHFELLQHGTSLP